MITTASVTDRELADVYKNINLTPGGLYVGRDGRELSEMKFHFSTEVKDLLAKLGLGKESLNSFDVNLSLERLGAVIGTDPSLVGTALQGVREFFEQMHAKLCELPDHPRLFRFGEVFQSKQSMDLVLDTAPVPAGRTAMGEGLVSNLQYSRDWMSYSQPVDLTHDQVIAWFDELNHGCKEGRHERSSTAGVAVEDAQTDKPVWIPPPISRDQVKLAFEWVEARALQSTDVHALSEPMAFLCHVVQQVSSKLAMMTGDGYESIPGTKLFSDPEKEKAISRVEIEHALLTSSPSELLETAKVGAVMVAVGGSALTSKQLVDLKVRDAAGQHVNANTYGMSHDRQMQSGLRVLRLIHQLSAVDPGLDDVLQLYGIERLSIPEGYAGLGAACARVWEMRDLLNCKVWAPRPEEYRELQNHLVQIISNGRASLGPSNTIQWDGLPRLTAEDEASEAKADGEA